MPQFDEKHVKVNDCYVVWDGITRPDKNQDGSPKYSLKVVVHPQNPDLPLVNQLANKSLMESKWKGQLPQGGRMPVGTADQTEFNGLFPGWGVFNCNSQRMPDVYDENGQRLDPMQFGQLLYGGQKVSILVHCYDYDKAGNRGIAVGLDGFAIIISANMPRQQFGSAGVDTSSAFGGQPGNGAPAPQYGQPGNGAPAPQPTAATYAPQYGQPGAMPAPAPAPQYGQPGTGAPAPQYAPDYNFLPPGQ